MWIEDLLRRKHSTVCTAVKERLGIKSMPESGLLPQAQSSEVLLAQRREGTIWGKKLSPGPRNQSCRQTKSQGSGAVSQMHFCLPGQMNFYYKLWLHLSSGWCR